jgi:hypothetical protein
MRTLVLAFGLASTLGAASTAAAADKEYTRSFTLKNDTTKTVVKLFAATAKYDGKTAPGTLVADNLKLAGGGSTTLKLTLQRGECVYHLRAETAGGGELRAYDVDVCSVNAAAKLSAAASPAGEAK